ncbi:Cation-independent mannose-6-phosphate receptor [Lucilia cuprina]|nr:Cation-independent mannose-6-phosphate receptor [Lucilia cuprina]
MHLTPIWCLLLIGCKVMHAASVGNENPLILSTNECSITEPVYGHKFDFSALHSDFAHLTRSDLGDTFEFNICGNITRKCNNRSDVAACLKRSDNKEYILGTQHQLNYHNGKMYFSFSNGEKCSSSNKKDETYQLHVFLGCDYTLDKNQSRVTSYAPDACSFYITFETPLACLPEPDSVKGNICNVHDSSTGHTFDLMPLSDNNYRTIDRQGNVFVINICKPVLYGENAMCPADSSVCFLKLNETDYKKKFINYGTVQPKPVLENGHLIMRHISPSPCNTTTNYSSTIYFYCDKEVKNAHPELMGLHGCSYEFSFLTPLACNDFPPCTVITHDNEIINMSSLMDKPFKLQQDNQNYIFSVCSSAGSPCMENDGACLFNNQSNGLGMFNTNLRINQTGAPYLLYENGVICTDKENTKWSTKIEFVCANKTSNSMGPKIIENSHCQLLIHYETDLACQEQIDCKAKVYVEHSEDVADMELIDLTPLINTVDNYEAEIDSNTITAQQVTKSTKFFLNVCRPLVPKNGLGCKGGTAVCMGKIDSNTGKLEEEQSLGFPLASLVAVNRTNAQLRYLMGDICPEDKNLLLSSRIEFYCNMRAGRGTPKLRKYADCHYEFTWATNVICPPHMCDFEEKTCEIKNSELGVSYNLKKATFGHEGKIKISKDNKEFTLDFCDEKNVHKAVTDYSQGLVNLFFMTNGSCNSNGLINVQMRLICSSSTEEPLTSFSGCNLLYIQKTPEICEFLGLVKYTATTKKATTTTTEPSPSQTTESNKKPNTNGDDGNKHPAERTGSIGTILATILSVTFFVACLGMFAFSPERRNSLRRLFNRTGMTAIYRRVPNSEEGNLLLNPNGEFTESDDEDMLL